ncbi:MAG: pyridoxamine 5'-phosphate oxidase family protein [Proteobacteria bacterium]|nr:pyridoxamine 5'-phosphate oxidase family protein [Pseudomonadota bacterium]
MAKHYDTLNGPLMQFITEQKIFFVASSTEGENVNLSPKGYESLAIIDESTVCYLDYPGSGNETARHTKSDGRLSMMFCSFDKKPLILRLYGEGEAVSPEGERFSELISLFKEKELDIVRQIIVLNIKSVMTSCGYGVPFFEYKGDRNQLRDWSLIKAKEGTLDKYMGKTKNRLLED